MAYNNSERPASRRPARRRRKVCVFCGGEEISYKDAAKLKKYVSERGKILPRRRKTLKDLTTQILSTTYDIISTKQIDKDYLLFTYSPKSLPPFFFIKDSFIPKFLQSFT